MAYADGEALSITSNTSSLVLIEGSELNYSMGIYEIRIQSMKPYAYAALITFSISPLRVILKRALHHLWTRMKSMCKVPAGFWKHSDNTNPTP